MAAREDPVAARGGGCQEQVVVEDLKGRRNSCQMGTSGAPWSLGTVGTSCCAAY